MSSPAGETEQRPGTDVDAVLAGFLGDCRNAIADVLATARNEKWATVRVEYTLAASKLMRTGVEIANAMQRRSRQTTHRVVVERPGEGGPSDKNEQTISSGSAEEVPQQ